MDSIKFVLFGKNDALSMYVVNNGTTDVLVNKKFSLAHAGDRGNVELIFTDTNGVKHLLVAKINYSKDDPQNSLLLPPTALIGKEISYSDLMEFYDLKPGIYIVQGVYKNANSAQDKPGLFVGRIESLPVKIEVKPK